MQDLRCYVVMRGRKKLGFIHKQKGRPLLRDFHFKEMHSQAQTGSIVGGSYPTTRAKYLESRYLSFLAPFSRVPSCVRVYAVLVIW